MEHQMIQGLRDSLANLRGTEERCRDAALAIQRVLEAEGALYPQGAATAEERGAIDAGLAGGAAPGEGKNRKAAKAAKAEKAAFKAEKAARQEKAAKMARVCPHCGDQYLAKRKDQTNCLAEACRKAAADAWKAKAAKEPKAPRPAAAPETGVEPGGSLTRLERIKALAGGGEVAP